MNLRDQMNMDARSLVLNTGELARDVDWNGKLISAVLRDEGEGIPDDESRPGVSVSVRSYIVHPDDIEPPRIGREVEIDGQKSKVARIDPCGALLKVQVWSERS